jgi:hypothetical protein
MACIPRNLLQGIVAAEDFDLFALNKLADLELGVSHFYAEGLGFRRAGHGATVIVGEHNDWNAFEVGPEHTLAGNVEVVAVDQPEDFFHGS